MSTEDPRLRVTCYSGYRGEETPLHFSAGFRTVHVVDVVDRWLAPDHRYFKLCGDDGAVYILRQDVTSGEWEITVFESGSCR